MRKKLEWGRDEKALLTAGLVLPGLALAGIAWSRIANEFPVVVIPETALPSPNAYDDYVRAGNLAVETLGSETIPAAQRKGAPLSASGRQRLVAANAPAVEALHAGFTKAYRCPPSRSFTQTFPEYAKYRSLARVQQFLAESAQQSGDLSTAAARATDAVQLGIDVPRGGTLIADLVGIACEAIGRRGLWNLADSLDAPPARQTISRLERLGATRTPYTSTLTEEKYAMQAGLGQLFRSASNPFDLARQFGTTSDTDGQADWKQALQIAMTSKRTAMTNITAYMDALIAQAKEPYRRDRPEVPLPPDAIGRMLAPVFSQAQFKDVINQAEHNLLTTYLAIRAFQKETGALPKSLDALVQRGLLKAVPVDPFAADGSPLRYRLERADRFTLYSVGPDGRDDQGRALVPKAEPGEKPSREPNRRNVQIMDDGDLVARVNTW